MSKIQTIHIQNFKAIEDLEMNFNGSTAIVTGANNSGKSSFLRGIVDRIRFIRPDIPVRQGEKEGKGELTLTTGERFVWEFSTEGKDKLTYITEQGRKSVTRELGEQFFKKTFDIDKFLESSPKQQVKQLQLLVGLDFTDLEKRYEAAYNIRTERNREAEIYHVKLEKMMKVDRVVSVNIDSLKAKKKEEADRLNGLYLDAKQKNQKTRSAWEHQKGVIDVECNTSNQLRELARNTYISCQEALKVLQLAGFTGGAEFLEELAAKIKPILLASDLYPPEPTYIEEMPDKTEMEKIDAELLAASETNAQAQKYMDYQDYKRQTEEARAFADEADLIVKGIEFERSQMIAGAKFPEGITITTEGIMIDGFPLSKDQLSTSKLYCSALRIAAMNLGEVRSLYFEASFLDKNTLSEINTWAEQNDLQLMLEMVDRDGGEIEYHLIEG